MMAVLVQKAVNIAQPLAKQQSEDTDESRNPDNNDVEVSQYLVKNKNAGEKKAVAIKRPQQADRLTKFEMFDGLNRFEAIEYESLDMVKDFSLQGTILAIKYIIHCIAKERYEYNTERI